MSKRVQKIIVKNVKNISKLAYSVNKLAKITSICRVKIYEELNAGKLVGKKCGERTIILHEDAARWLGELQTYKKM